MPTCLQVEVGIGALLLPPGPEHRNDFSEAEAGCEAVHVDRPATSLWPAPRPREIAASSRWA